jgi:hypothetical protein
MVSLTIDGLGWLELTFRSPHVQRPRILAVTNVVPDHVASTSVEYQQLEYPNLEADKLSSKIRRILSPSVLTATFHLP